MIGQQVGKYQILERIGRGGMGTVYRAMDETLRREVAIKALNAELNDPEVARRFRAEAITVARLNHPGIATIYELFEHEGQWLMVMEFVRGETLEHQVDRMGALSPQRAAELCMQALTALAHAHSLGVVHRDLKPANLMITEAGVVKIMDFGIARVSGSEHLTGAGFMMGTPAYMAPEQVMGGDIDSRADLYAMGVVFYRLACGKLPFKGDTPFAMAHSQVHDPPTPIGMQRSDLPAWADQIVARALAKLPDMRFQSAVEFYEAFSRCLAGLPMTALYNPSAQTGMLQTPSRAMATGAMGGPTPTPLGMPPAYGSSGSRTGPISKSPTGALTPTNPPILVKPSLLQGKNLTIIGLVAAVVLLLVTVIAVWFIASGRSQPAVTPTPVASTTPTPTVDPNLQASVTPTPTPTDTPVPTPTVAATPLPTAAPPPPATPTPTPTARPTSSPTPTRTPPASQALGRATTSPTPTSPPVASPTTPTPTAAATTPTPTATPEVRPQPPAAANDEHIFFVGVKLLRITGTKSSEQDVIVNFVGGNISVVAKSGGAAMLTLPYRSIARATYVKAKLIKYDASLPSPPAELDMPAGILGLTVKNWLVLQSRSGYTVLNLPNKDAVKILETIEARLGIKVDRAAGEK